MQRSTSRSSSLYRDHQHQGSQGSHGSHGVPSHAFEKKPSLMRSISSNNVHGGVSYRNKNIPMISHLKRWNTSTDITKRNHSDDQLKSESQNLNQHHQPHQHQNSQLHRSNHTSSTQLHLHSHLHSHVHPHSNNSISSNPHSLSLTTNTHSNRSQSSAAHNSMHSLVPMGVYQKMPSSYQSQSDDDSDEDSADGEQAASTTTTSRLDDYLFYPQVDNSIKENTISPQDIKEALAEIQDFQNNFVQKYSNDPGTEDNSIQTPTTSSLSRTQQKILDHKELAELKPSSNNSLDYNMKMQNETIISQYTLIRLRFTNSYMGVLGYLKRSIGSENSMGTTNNSTSSMNGYGDQPSTTESPTTQSINTNQPFYITKENKDQYLSDLWNSEMQVFENTGYLEDNAALSVQSSVTLEPSFSSNGMTSEDEGMERSRSVSEMARSVHLLSGI
ncbi:hypothetical protein CAAN3_09S07008 [[Candida] anglica]